MVHELWWVPKEPPNQAQPVQVADEFKDAFGVIHGKIAQIPVADVLDARGDWRLVGLDELELRPPRRRRS